MLEKGYKAKLHTRYPLSSILTYNGTTILHYTLGGIGIIIGYSSWVSLLLGLLYTVLSLVEMYVLMPLKVCPNCPYYRLDNSLCISGLNIVARKIAKQGNVNDFPKRAGGIFCPNNLYIASLIIPIIAMIPALVLDFSFLVIAILLAVAGLLLFRFLVIFPRIACLHCIAKYKCPQAEAMGVREL
ncbi:hypothetical protein ACFLT3_01625 [Chloroflexota bacterium]